MSSVRWAALLPLVVGLALLAACAPEIERTGLSNGADAPSPTVEARWAAVTDEPAIEALTARGTVVVQAAERVTAPALARIVDLPVAQGDPVAVGDVIAVLQPTTAEIEAFDLAARNLAAATVAAGGPAATRPTAEEIEALVAARDAAAIVVRDTEVADLEPVPLVATSAGVVVAVSMPLGTLVGPGDLVATVGPVSSVEVHVRVDNAVLELFVSSADSAVLLERAAEGDSQAIVLAPSDERVVSQEENETILRMVFVESPRVTEGQRVDVEVAVDPAQAGQSVPLGALRVFDGATFILIERDDGGVGRVDVEVTRLGPERVEVVGDVDLGDRVLLR